MTPKERIKDALCDLAPDRFKLGYSSGIFVSEWVVDHKKASMENY